MPPVRGRPGVASLLLALAVGLVLADSSVVTLALPAILREFDSTVDAVAWVLIAFNLALALLALAGARVARGRARRALGVSLVLFAVASLACAAAPSLAVLIAARTAQGIAGAVVVAAALELLVALNGRRRAIALWAAAGVLGAAVGPALGGFLTEAFSWEAMFALQAPVTLLTLLGLVGAADVVEERGGGGDRPAVAPLVALGLASAALSAALFLLVIMLIEGWRQSPGEAALTVTVMPVAAILAGRWARGRHDLVPGLAGCVLVAGGLAALGLLPGAHAAWTIAPQIAIGLGLGMALATLIGATVGDSGAVARPAAWTIGARHLGIVVGLLVLTPIFTADLETVRGPGEDAGLARVLDAPLALQTKLDVARALGEELRGGGEDQTLPDIARAFAAAGAPASERAELAQLQAQLEDELDRAATEAFSRSFIAAALLALLAAGAVGVAVAGSRDPGRPRGEPETNGSPLASGAPLAVAVPAAAVAATLLVAAYVLLGGGGYEPAKVANPCAPRARPAVERTQLVALAALDGTACKLGVTREALVRDLLTGSLPPGVSDDELEDALGDGIDRAQDEGYLSGLAAGALRVALKVGGALGLIGRLLGSP
jgi:MFS family permease